MDNQKSHCRVARYSGFIISAHMSIFGGAPRSLFVLMHFEKHLADFRQAPKWDGAFLIAVCAVGAICLRRREQQEEDVNDLECAKSTKCF